MRKTTDRELVRDLVARSMESGMIAAELMERGRLNEHEEKKRIAVVAERRQIMQEVNTRLRTMRAKIRSLQADIADLKRDRAAFSDDMIQVLTNDQQGTRAEME